MRDFCLRMSTQKFTKRVSHFTHTTAGHTINIFLIMRGSITLFTLMLEKMLVL